MKQSLVLSLAAIAVVAALVFYQRRFGASEPTPVARDATRPVEAASDLPLENDIPADLPDDSREGPPVIISGDKALATVNGVAITLRDLMAVSATNTTERSMSTVGYQYLLDRAIHRELVRQEAAARGIQLNREHQAQLAQIEQALYGRDGVNPDNVLGRPNSSATLEEQLAFEVRDATGLLLQKELLAANGVPPPYVTDAQVQTHYEQRRQQFAPLPESGPARDAAWREISNQIRQELTFANLQSYQAEQDAYLAALRSKATIQVTQP